MFHYGTMQSENIPGPQIRLKIQSPQKGSLAMEFDAILDTGAAITCVPKHVIESIGKETLPYNSRLVRGAVGKGIRVDSFRVHLAIASCRFEHHEVIVLDRPFGLIGRDILNKYLITLDGPQEMYDWLGCSYAENE